MSTVVDYEHTIRVHMATYFDGGSALDAAEELGITRDAYHGRIGHLRKRGVVLPKLDSHQKLSKETVDKLNDFVRELEQEHRDGTRRGRPRKKQ